MKYTGTVKEGVVVFETAPPFNNGTMVTVEAIGAFGNGMVHGRKGQRISSEMIAKWRARAKLPMGSSGSEYLRMARDGDLG